MTVATGFTYDPGMTQANEDFPVTDADWEKMTYRIQGQPSVDECWQWTGAFTLPNKVSTGGYPRTPRIAGKNRLAHRAAWIFFRGDLGAGLTIDHLCRNRGCVNPWHMDPVPQAVNARRSPYFSQEKTHCPYGHPMDGRRETGRDIGAQYCKTCNRLHAQRWRANKAG